MEKPKELPTHFIDEVGYTVDQVEKMGNELAAKPAPKPAPKPAIKNRHSKK